MTRSEDDGVGSEMPEPLEPDRVVTAEERFADEDPRRGVADVNKIPKMPRRPARGRGPKNRNHGSERHNEGRRPQR
jgi:hypothetical protein